VRVRLQFEAGGSRRPFDHPGEACRRERGSPLADEDERRRLALPLEPPQGPELVTVQGMGAGCAVLDPPHVQDGAVEVDLVPAQVTGLGGTQPVPEGHQDHGRVPVTVPVGLGRLDQGLDLAGRQVLPGPKLRVRTPDRSNCSIYFSWRDQLEVKITNSLQAGKPRVSQTAARHRCRPREAALAISLLG
jgi:hypothetical protein